jgi:hypothetical protein
MTAVSAEQKLSSGRLLKEKYTPPSVKTSGTPADCFSDLFDGGHGDIGKRFTTSDSTRVMSDEQIDPELPGKL